MTDDEIALKLMQLYRELRRAEEADVRQAVCTAIDSLVALLKSGAPVPDTQRKAQASFSASA